MTAMDKLHDLGAADRARVIALLSNDLASNPRVAFAYLYGSFLEGRAFHDIDVGVYLAGGVARDADDEIVLSERLSGVVHVPVDVRVLNGAPPTFLFHVLRGERLACHDEERLADVMERTAQRYLDIEPVLRQATREAFTS